MKEFSALRLKARDIRDKAIDHARRECESSLASIAALEQDLLGIKSERRTKLIRCVESVIPRDKEFTIADIMSALQALDPKRAWRRQSVDRHV